MGGFDICDANRVSREAAKARRKTAKIALIEQAVRIIEANGWHVKAGSDGRLELTEWGFLFNLMPHTNTIRYCGVSASCTWSRDHGLISAWREAAGRYLRRELRATQ